MVQNSKRCDRCAYEIRFTPKKFSDDKCLKHRIIDCTKFGVLLHADFIIPKTGCATWKKATRKQIKERKQVVQETKEVDNYIQSSKPLRLDMNTPSIEGQANPRSIVQMVRELVESHDINKLPEDPIELQDKLLDPLFEDGDGLMEEADLLIKGFNKVKTDTP